MQSKIIRIKNIKYTINIVLFVFIYLLININITYATIVKCSDFFNILKNNTALDGKIDQCISYSPVVETSDGLASLYDAELNKIKKDRDENVPLYQPDLSITNGNNGLENVVSNSNISSNLSSDDLNNIIDNVRLCGYGWNTYVYERSSIKNNIDKNTWYPSFGSFPNSYQYKLDKIFNNIFSCDEYYELNNNGEIVFNDLAKRCLENNNNLNSSECSYFKSNCFPIIPMYTDGRYCDSGYCTGINESTKNIKNRFYREYLYSGIEFKIPTQANAIDLSYPDILRDTKHLYKNGGGCFDPRLDSDKGYTGLEQRYYFKGNEAANYACERFEYRGQGCVNYNGQEVYGQNSQECQILFEFAKMCCEHRRNGGVCVYTPTLFSSAIANGKANNKTEYSTVFNGVQYDFKLTSDKKISNSPNVAFCSKYANTNGANTCELKFGNGKLLLLNAYYGQLDDDIKVVANGNTDKICVRTGNLYPNNFNLLNGTEIQDLYCDGYYTLCNNPLNEEVESDNFSIWDDNYANDFSKIWTTNVKNGGVIQTDVYGKTKNIYTFNAHCVDSSFKAVDLMTSSIRRDGSSKFSPAVCSDFSKGASQNSASYDTTGKAILSFVTGNNNLNITAPMAECLLETAKNMFLNKAAISLCKDPDETINREGLCGYDTFGPPISIRHEKYDARYSGESNAYEYIIGETLPQEYNVFYKIQSFMRNIIKVILMLGIVAAGARILISGDLDLFGMKKVKEIILWVIKFSLVMYFALSDAWQSKFYNMLMSSMEFMYNKMFQISLLGYDNYKAIYDEIKCDLRTTTETMTKGYTRMCYVESIKEIQQNYIVYDEPGYYVYEIPEGTESIEIKIWGASAGTEISNSNIQPGKGGYSYGVLDIEDNLDKIQNNKLYIYVGGMANTGCNLSNEEEQKYANCEGYFSCGGFNGGGSGAKGYYNNGQGGGGATDIRFIGGKWNNIDSLNSRFIVAGGGGGMANTTLNEQKYSGGVGGGGNNNGTFIMSNLVDIDNYRYACFGTGGTDSSGGVGGNCSKACKSDNIFDTCISNNLCTNINYCLLKQECLNLCKREEKCTVDSFYNVCRSGIVNDDCRFNSGIFGAGGNGREGYYGGSGGGGGYYGGGASSEIIQRSNVDNYIGGAGGGSGYINTSILTDFGGESGVRFGHGRVEIKLIGASDSAIEEVLEAKNDDIPIYNLPEDIRDNDIDNTINVDNNTTNNNIDNNITTNEDNNNSNENLLNKSCVITNKVVDPNLGTIIYKICYSNCQPRIRDEEYDMITIDEETLYPDFTITSFDPDNVPTDEEVKMSSYIIEEDETKQITLNTYWKNCEFVITDGMRYSDKYDGCYFGDIEYPAGKEYLAIFDTLDCKIAHYFNLAVGNTATIIWMILFFYILSNLGLLFTVVIFFMLTIILLITAKIFFIFVTNTIGITFMVFVSPFTLPFALIPRFKNIFDAWLSNLMGFCLQVILVVSFTGFVMTSIDSFALGDARYINHNDNGRLPTLHCDARDGFSILCLLSSNASSGTQGLGIEILDFLGLGPIFSIADYIINPDGGYLAMLVEIFSFLIVSFVLMELLDKIPDLSRKLFSGPGMQKANTNFRSMMGKVTTYGGNASYQLVRAGRVMTRSLTRELTKMFTGERGNYKKTWANRFKPVTNFFRNNFTKDGRDLIYTKAKEKEDNKKIEEYGQKKPEEEEQAKGADKKS